MKFFNTSMGGRMLFKFVIKQLDVAYVAPRETEIVFTVYQCNRSRNGLQIDQRESSYQKYPNNSSKSLV